MGVGHQWPPRLSGNGHPPQVEASCATGYTGTAAATSCAYGPAGDDRYLLSGCAKATTIGVDVEVILTPPCIFCMENH